MIIQLAIIAITCSIPYNQNIADIKDTDTCQTYALNNCARCYNLDEQYADIQVLAKAKPTCTECANTGVWQKATCVMLPNDKRTISGWGRACAECGKGNYWSSVESTCKPCSFESAGCTLSGGCCTDGKDLGCSDTYSLSLATQRCECSKGAHFVLYGKCYCSGQSNVFIDMDSSTGEIKCVQCTNKCPVGCENYVCPKGTFLSGCECKPIHYSCADSNSDKEDECKECKSPFEKRSVSNGKTLCLCPCCYDEVNMNCVKNGINPYEVNGVCASSNLVPKSNILTQDDFTNYLNPWLSKVGSNAKLTLLYNAISSNYSSTSFHNTCNFINSLLIVIKDSAGKVFGGYTPIMYSNSNSYKADPSLKTFLFSMDVKKMYPILWNRFEASIYDSIFYGPTFGGGHDIYISANGENGYRNMNTFDYSSGYDSSAFNRFNLDKMEVYTVKFSS